MRVDNGKDGLVHLYRDLHVDQAQRLELALDAHVREEHDRRKPDDVRLERSLFRLLPATTTPLTLGCVLQRFAITVAIRVVDRERGVRVDRWERGEILGHVAQDW